MTKIPWFSQLKRPYRTWQLKNFIQLTQKAGDWSECPTQGIDTPRNQDGEPINREIYKLGIHFLDTMFRASIALEKKDQKSWEKQRDIALKILNKINTHANLR